MTSYNVTAEFAAGSAGTVTFRREVWLNDNGAIVPPADVVATLAGMAPGFVQSLRATNESGVTPVDWEYEVIVNLTGQDELRGSMALTAASDLADIFQWETATTGEFYATKGDLSALTAALGNPVSQADLQAEEDARIASDDTLSGEIDDAVADIGGHETRLDALEANVTALLARGYVVNTDGEDDTLYIGETDPDLVDPPLDPLPAEGSAWWDTTEAP